MSEPCAWCEPLCCVLTGALLRRDLLLLFAAATIVTTIGVEKRYAFEVCNCVCAKHAECSGTVGPDAWPAGASGAFDCYTFLAFNCYMYMYSRPCVSSKRDKPVEKLEKGGRLAQEEAPFSASAAEHLPTIAPGS